MKRNVIKSFAMVGLAFGPLLLASCGPKKIEVPVVSLPPPPPPPPVMIPLPHIELAPTLIGESREEDLWHLRSALNVAVLLCRDADREVMIASYNRLLTQHKPLLAAANQAVVDRYKLTGGKTWQDAYDDHMTRVYNGYSGTLTRERFCAISRTILAEVEAATADILTGRATTHLWEINKAAGLRDPDGALARAARTTAAVSTVQLTGAAASMPTGNR